MRRLLSDNQQHIILTHPDLTRREAAELAGCTIHQVDRLRATYGQRSSVPDTVRTHDRIDRDSKYYKAIVYLMNPIHPRHD